MASNSRYLREGIIAGIIGAAIVAVWFLIYDAARGPDIALVIATGERRIYANILLTIGVVPPA